MNWEQVQGQWTVFKGKLREQYGDLSDDEVEQARGNREQLEGIIEQKYGKTKETVRTEIDRLLSEV